MTEYDGRNGIELTLGHEGRRLGDVVMQPYGFQSVSLFNP